MNGTRKTRIAKAAMASALGIGAITFGLRAAPAVQRAIARLRTPDTGSTAPVAAVDAETARTYLASNDAAGSAAVAQSIALFQKNGTFAGKREYAYYGYVRVQAVIKNGSLTDVQILEYPNDNGRSHYINNVALPYLMQEAVDAQSYRVDFISGATFTSNAFVKSLREALAQAGEVVQTGQART